MTRVVAVALVGFFAVLATLTGIRAGDSVADVDEVVYRQTLLEMRTGEGYYDAMRDALAAKEHAPPSQVRSIRPPTMFLVLRWFPEQSWRWLAGIAYLGILLAVWRLADVHIGWPVWLAVAVAGIWVKSYSHFLFLHPEIWGAPLFLAGLLAYRRGQDRRAAILMAAATVVRELFALGLVLGLLLRRRRAWLVALLVVAALAAFHAILARQVLDTGGREAPFGDERRTLAFLLHLVSPGRDSGSHVIGVGGLVLGLVGLARARRSDPAAAFALLFVVVMLALSVWSTRVYWSAVWAPPLVAFLPAVILRREDLVQSREPGEVGGQ